MVGDARKTWEHPPSFNGHNYDTWAKKMKTIMVANDLWEFSMNVFNYVTKPTQYATLTKTQKTQLKKSRRKDEKALSLIQAAMIETIFHKIKVANYSIEAWDILEENLRGIDKV